MQKTGNLTLSQCNKAQFTQPIPLHEIDAENTVSEKKNYYIKPCGRINYELVLTSKDTIIFPSPIQTYIDVLRFTDMRYVLQSLNNKLINETSFIKLNISKSIEELKSELHAVDNSVSKYCLDINEPLLAAQYLLHYCRDYSFLADMQLYYQNGLKLVLIRDSAVTSTTKEIPALNRNCDIFDELQGTLFTANGIPVYDRYIPAVGFKEFVRSETETIVRQMLPRLLCR